MLLRKNYGHTRMIWATRSLGSPVIIVQVRSHSPDSGSFQFSQRPAKVNGRPSFMAIANGSFGLGFSESLAEGRRSIDGLSSGADGPVSDLRVFRPIRD